jgi:hypothetical protein
VGLAGPFVSGVAQKLQVTGNVPTQPPGEAAPVNAEVVPSTATSAVFNVTVVRPQTKGFLSIRPGDASGTPATSNINFGPGGPNIANAVTVQLPPSGTVDIFVNGTASEVLVDVAGYHVPAAAGPPGPQGEPGVDAVSPAQVVRVATSGGDFTSPSAALASITDASAAKPYVIKIAPGVYTETSTVTLKDHVDIEGSGQRVTTLICDCAASSFPGAFVSAGNITAEIRHVTIENTGAGGYATGLATDGVTDGSFSMLHVTISATAVSNSYGVYNNASSAVMNHVTATATAVANGRAIYNTNSSPVMNRVTATATDSNDSYGVFNSSSSPLMNNVTATATGGIANTGMMNGSSSPTIRGSVITGDTNSILNIGTSPSAQVADTTLDGPVTGSGFACVGVHNAAFVALNASCT